MEHVMPFFGKRANMPVACLPLLATLTPAEHTITLVDENVEALDFDRLAQADIVGLTGMIVQRQRMREILTELKGRGAFTIVGGLWVSLQADQFGDPADGIFVGEAEETWPQYLLDRKAGCHRRYEQAQKTGLTKMPTSRFELLEMRHYLFGSVQLSYGCPSSASSATSVAVAPTGKESHVTPPALDRTAVPGQPLLGLQLRRERLPGPAVDAGRRLQRLPHR